MDVDEFGAPKIIEEYYDDRNTLKTILNHDPYGNLEYIKFPNGMFYKYTYDDDTHKWPEIIKDAFNYESRIKYDLKFDVPLDETDISLNTIKYTYDDLGRLVMVKGSL